MTKPVSPLLMLTSYNTQSVPVVLKQNTQATISVVFPLSFGPSRVCHHVTAAAMLQLLVYNFHFSAEISKITNKVMSIFVDNKVN